MAGAEPPILDIPPIDPIDPKSTNPASTNASSASLLAFKSIPRFPFEGVLITEGTSAYLAGTPVPA